MVVVAKEEVVLVGSSKATSIKLEPDELEKGERRSASDILSGCSQVAA